LLFTLFVVEIATIFIILICNDAKSIQKNSVNLMKSAAMQVIRQVTGMPDSEILEGIEIKS